MSYNAITELVANTFGGLSSLTSLNLESNDITELVANTFDGLSSLTTLDLDDNAITELAANTFAGLSSLTTLDLSYNDLTELVANSFEGLSSLTELDLRYNAITAVAVDNFAWLSSLATFPYFEIETKESRQAAIAFCSNATTQTPPLAVAGTDFCAGYSTVSSEEMMFLAISASVSVFAGLLVLLQLCRKKGSGSITRWDLLHVAFFSLRNFDLYTDFGVYRFTAQKPDWDTVMAHNATLVK